jgi:acyl-CoA thioester hydrolase
MFVSAITPRFYETDALGHINNTVVSCWFETAREPMFRIFNPTLSMNEWNLIIARVEIDYVAQIHYGYDVEIQTGIGRIGNSSFDVEQKAFQNGVLVAKGKVVQVYFNYETQKPESIPDVYRTALKAQQWPEHQA